MRMRVTKGANKPYFKNGVRMGGSLPEDKSASVRVSRENYDLLMGYSIKKNMSIKQILDLAICQLMKGK